MAQFIKVASTADNYKAYVFSSANPAVEIFLTDGPPRF